MTSSKRQGQTVKWSWRQPGAKHCPHAAPSNLHSATPSIVLNVKSTASLNAPWPREKSNRHHHSYFCFFFPFPVFLGSPGSQSSLTGIQSPSARMKHSYIYIYIFVLFTVTGSNLFLSVCSSTEQQTGAGSIKQEFCKRSPERETVEEEEDQRL